MPLDKYGVLIAQKTNYFRDAPDNFGKFYHGNLIASANGVSYHCAIDVDSKALPNGVWWRVVELGAGDLGAVQALGDGWHLLPSQQASGAIDYIRSPFMWITLRIPYLIDRPFRIPPWIWRTHVRAFSKPRVTRSWNRVIRLEQSSFWRKGTSLDAVQELESVLAQGEKVYVYGQFFNSGNGVHDIHQNQGDPLTSPWAATNGIWQDGATVVRRANGTYVGFFNKFSTQSFHTDDLGHPI